jgi:hypothetical protein
VHEYDNDHGHQEEYGAKEIYDFLFTLGKPMIQQVQTNVSITGSAVGESDHDAYGIEMPLQFFKSYQALRKYVAENDLRDDHNNQGDVQPSRSFSDT